MQQILLLTRSLEIAHSSKTQVVNMRSCVEQLTKDIKKEGVLIEHGDLHVYFLADDSTLFEIQISYTSESQLRF